MGNRVDLTGMLFGEWTVIGPEEIIRSGKAYNYLWTCRCSCGTIAKVEKYNLIKRKTSGCRACYSSRHLGTNNQNWKGGITIPGAYFNSLKWGAKARNIEFYITIQDMENCYTGICALSGVPIEIGVSASLDRIDSKKPYIVDNIQWTHKTINRMKNDIDEDEFLRFCREVAKFKMIEI